MKKTYDFENLGCAHCAAKMEEKINKLPEVTNASISFPMKRLYVDTMKEDILPQLQNICSSIEPDVLLHEADKTSRKRKNTKPTHKHEHHDDHDCCDDDDCCGHDHEHEEHHHHHDDDCCDDDDCCCGHDHEHEEHHHHHDNDCCDDDDCCGHDHEHEEHHHHHDDDCCDDDDCCCGHDHEHEEHHHHHGDVAAAHEGTGTPTIFIVENLGCAHCAGKMEEQIGNLSEVEAANLAFATKQLRVWAPDAKSLLPKIQEICSSIEPQVHVVLRPDRRQESNTTKETSSKMSEDTKALISIISGIVLFIAGKILEPSFLMAADACFIVAYVILGARIVMTALKNITRGQVFDENFLMSVATIGAFAVGDFAEAVGVMLFYRIGELFEDKAVERSRSQIMDVIDMRPEVVHYVDEDGSVTDIDAIDAEIGDIVVVRPGDRIPLDGIVTEGETMVDTSPVTGEPVPVAISAGSSVISGCVNTSGLIHMKVEKPLEESMVTRIMDSVENAAASKPKMDRFITRFSKVYTPFVVCLALATAIIPSIITGHWNHWIYTALTFLVISCPCALVLSVPLAFFSGIGAGSKKGILFKGGVALETLKNVKSVVMDKTGTITKGNFKVQDIIPLGKESKDELLAYAAACEAGSTHPIAKSIMDAVKEKEITYPSANSVKEIAGHGSVITINGSEVLAGNQKLMDLYHIKGNKPDSIAYGTEVLLAKDGVLIGYIIISDTLKDDAKSAIQALKSQGLHTVMLTGDSEASANAIAKKTGIDAVYSRLLPDEKLARLKEERSKHGSVMFIGDGINDAPVLAGADCGAAMGSGADAAIEAADVVFMQSSVSAIPTAIKIGKKSCRIAWQNVIFALIIKVLVMILGLLGFANMWMAVFADTGVAMICILNSIRAMRTK